MATHPAPLTRSSAPITRQIRPEPRGGEPPVNVRLEETEDCLMYDRHGRAFPFRDLYEDGKSIIVFVRNFLCYTCKEYVDDLSRIPREVLEEAGVRLVVIGQSAHRHIEPFCSLTGFPHEIYVDPERRVHRRLGMLQGEEFTESASPSPHVKSGMLVGHMKSLWRAVTSQAFDFQGDPRQQGGALIAGPGPKVHFVHLDQNRLDHMPIPWLLQLAGVTHSLDLSQGAKVIHV